MIIITAMILQYTGYKMNIFICLSFSNKFQTKSGKPCYLNSKLIKL